MPRHDYNWLERINRYQPTDPALPWSWLSKTDIVQRILFQWNSLLQTPNIAERKLTEFLKRNAGLFFHFENQYPFALSEIRLGSHYAIDFALADDRWSDGTLWSLIEIELPSTPPFNKDGSKSMRLSRSLDQIEHWRSWLKRCCRMTQELFPCSRWNPEAYLKFIIVIGTRENSSKWIERRNELSKDYGVEIRSFDWLTDCLKRGTKWINDTSHWEAHDQGPFAPMVANALGNPLYEAFTHVEWKETIRECCNCDRIMDLNADVILKHRHNSEVFKEFSEFCQARTEEYAIWKYKLISNSLSDSKDLRFL
ncbi:MAG: Shedu anti-phage system protein SduA domain-containing protein [Chthoniobacterales bacterium]